MWQKSAIAAIVLSLLFSCKLEPLYASWWDMKSLPVPGPTQKIKEKNHKFEQAEFDVIYYSSTLSTEAISNFYNDRLPKLGWQQRNIMDDLNQIKDLPDISDLGGLMGDSLIFRKGNDTIVIRFIAQSEKETQYILGRNKLFLEKNEPMDIATLPRQDLEMRHKNIPRYTDAKLINLKEGADFFNATYLSSDDPMVVAKFYKNSLLGDGWKLDLEKSPNKVYPSKSEGFYKGLQAGVLDFSKTNGESCKIHVAQHIFDENKAGKQSDITYITITYEK